MADRQQIPKKVQIEGIPSAGLHGISITEGVKDSLYETLKPFIGQRVRVTVELEQTCSCGAKTFDRSGLCYKCEQDEAYFEANYS